MNLLSCIKYVFLTCHRYLPAFGLLAIGTVISCGCFPPSNPPEHQTQQMDNDLATSKQSAPDSNSIQTVEVFAGSASKPATEQAAAHFEKKTGIKVLLHFGGSGKMLSQLLLGERGDIYFPGSSDYMEKAKRKNCVFPDTEKRIVYLIPAINVPAHNKAGITSLKDLTNSSLRLGIARPDSVCVGLYGVEVLQKAGLWEQVQPQIVTNAASCAQTAQLVALDHVDAVMGWRVFQYWNPAKIKTVLIAPEKIPRIGYIPAAISTFTKNRKVAQQFIDFLSSNEGQAIFRSWSYIPTVEEARKYATPQTPVGGEWKMSGSQ